MAWLRKTLTISVVGLGFLSAWITPHPFHLSKDRFEYLIHPLKEQGYTVLKKEDMFDLASIVLNNGSRVFVLPDGKHLLVGHVYDADGHLVPATKAEQDELASSQDTTASGANDSVVRQTTSVEPQQENQESGQTPDLSAIITQALHGMGMQPLTQDQKESLNHAYGFHEGDRGRQIFVFVDMDCPFCQHDVQILEPLIQKGEFQVSWIPVALVKADSTARGLAMLAQKNPLKALHENFDHYNATNEEGGLVEHNSDKNTENLRHLDENSKILLSVSPQGRPTTPLTVLGIHGDVYAIPGAMNAQIIDFVKQTQP